MSKDAMEVAQDALDLARDAKREITSHEETCAERMGFINTKLGSMEKWITWILGTVILTLLAAIGALIMNVITNGQAQNQAFQQQIHDLQNRPLIAAPDVRVK